MSAERSGEPSGDGFTTSLECYGCAFRSIETALEKIENGQRINIRRLLIDLKDDLEYGLAWQAQGR